MHLHQQQLNNKLTEVLPTYIHTLFDAVHRPLQRKRHHKRAQSDTVDTTLLEQCVQAAVLVHKRCRGSARDHHHFPIFAATAISSGERESIILGCCCCCCCCKHVAAVVYTHLIKHTQNT